MTARCGTVRLMSTGGVATGTVIVTHVATGLFGTVVYTRSGQLREPETRRTAVVLGWRLAHALSAQQLKFAMVIGLLTLAPYLALHG